MSAIGESNVRTLGSSAANPLRSRSTVIFLACLFALLWINYLAWLAGFFNTEFAIVSVYILKEIMNNVAAHQKAANVLPTEKPL